jgi:hypothetical protein
MQEKEAFQKLALDEKQNSVHNSIFKIKKIQRQTNFKHSEMKTKMWCKFVTTSSAKIKWCKSIKN